MWKLFQNLCPSQNIWSLTEHLAFTYCISFNFRAPEDEIWKHVDFILRQDQLEGVKVFIKRQECEEQKKLPVDVGKCENILNFLQQFPIAKMTYLEFLVKQKKLQVSFKLLIIF